jgi:hypothetical protein
MALLQIPISLSTTGAFERAGTDENVVDVRLRLFLLSGMGQYLRLPSPAVRALWGHLYTMGPSARFSDCLAREERGSLEVAIREELEAWLEGVTGVSDVTLVGDEHEENGIRFVTTARETLFRFRYARPGMIGCWDIIEESHAIQ